MARPLLYDRPALDAAVFALISDAASRGDRVPSILDISKATHVRRETVRTTIERLAEAGRIVDRGAFKAPAGFVPETGRETARVRVGRPASGRDVKDRNGLTPGQREVLSIARQLARQGLEICAATVAPRIGLTREGALSRLHRVAGNGHLRPTEPGKFVLVDAAAVQRAAPQPVTTIRADGIRVTRYPPMIADGALLYGCGSGRGMVGLSECGGRRTSGRAA